MLHAWGVGFATAEEIDQLGIVPATQLAAWRAVDSFPAYPDPLADRLPVFA